MERIITRFAASAALRPSKVALITERNQLTYDDLLYLVEVFETRLRTAGVKQGAKVILTSDRSEFVIAGYMVASRMSLTMIIATPRIVEAANEHFDHVLASEAVDGFEDDPRLILIKEDWFAALGAGRRPDMTHAYGDGAVIVGTTSGSTGRPKLVAASEAERLTHRSSSQAISDLTPRTRFLSTMATRQNWTATSILNTLFAGGSAVALSDHRNRFLPYIDQYRVNMLLTTPMTIRQMLEVPLCEQYLTTLEQISVSGALTSSELLTQLAKRTTAAIRYGYGMTEVGGVAGADFDRNGQQKEGYLGKVYRKDLEIAFFDDRLEVLPEANEGIVGFKSTDAHNDRRYLGSVESDDKTGFVNGFFIPGDIIRREGSDLYFVGRSKSILNVGGNKYSLDVLQERVEQDLGLTHACCAAISDAYGIEHLHLAYEAEQVIEKSAFDQVLMAISPDIRVTRLVRVKKMAMTESGKVDTASARAVLRQDALN